MVRRHICTQLTPNMLSPPRLHTGGLWLSAQHLGIFTNRHLSFVTLQPELFLPAFLEEGIIPWSGQKFRSCTLDPSLPHTPHQAHRQVLCCCVQTTLSLSASHPMVSTLVHATPSPPVLSANISLKIAQKPSGQANLTLSSHPCSAHSETGGKVSIWGGSPTLGSASGSRDPSSAPGGRDLGRWLPSLDTSVPNCKVRYLD